MNIAYVVPEFVTEVKGGGLATYINNISHVLAMKGHIITIIVKSETNESFEFSNGIFVERVYVDLTNVNLNIPGSIYSEWSRRLNERLLYIHENIRKMDVVQYANWNALGYFRTKIPTVVRVSSDLPYWRAANTLEYSKDAVYVCTKATDYLEELALMNADKVLGPSQLLADIISKRTGTPIEIIESPFEMRHFIEDETVYKENLNSKKYILTYGNLNLLKGSKLIGDAIYELLSKNEEIFYVLAGNDGGWSDEKGNHVSAVQYIKDNAGEFSNRVIYLGALQREKLYPIIKNALVCALPSRVDNLPNACIEAMALNKVVVGTRGASFEQLIEDGENGFLIEREDKKSFIECIINVLNLDLVEKIRIGKNANARIQRMNSDIIGNKMIQLYEEVISETSCQRNEAYYNFILNEYNLVIGKQEKRL